MAAAARETHGVRVATARAGNVIGGGDWGRDRLVPDLVRARDSGAAVVLRHPEAVRPWQHVLDPLAGYLLLAERLAESADWAAPWNFGPDDAETVRWIVDRVRSHWPLDVQVVPPGDGIEAPALRLDASKSREQLGWEPRLDLAAALDATVFWHDQRPRRGRPADRDLHADRGIVLSTGSLGGRSVLVTGAGGFIGGHLVERLVREGAQVRALVRYNSRNERGTLDWLPASVTRDVDVVAR